MYILFWPLIDSVIDEHCHVVYDVLHESIDNLSERTITFAEISSLCCLRVFCSMVNARIPILHCSCQFQLSGKIYACCLFFWGGGGGGGGLRLYVPVNNFSVMLRRSHRFLGITSTFLGGKCILLKDATRRLE